MTQPQPPDAPRAPNAFSPLALPGEDTRSEIILSPEQALQILADSQHLISWQVTTDWLVLQFDNRSVIAVQWRTADGLPASPPDQLTVLFSDAQFAVDLFQAPSETPGPNDVLGYSEPIDPILTEDFFSPEPRFIPEYVALQPVHEPADLSAEYEEEPRPDLAVVRTLLQQTPSVNLPPTLSYPETQATNEDSAITFMATNGNGLSFTDPDIGTANASARLAVSHGTLDLGTTAGVTFSAGDGVADSDMAFTGSMNSINTALDGLRFTSPPDYNGTASLSITISDLGNSGTGGALTSSGVITLSIHPVNDPPVNTLLIADETIRFETLTTYDLRVQDPDADTIVTLHLEASSPQSPQAPVDLVLINPEAGPITVIDGNGSDGTLIVQGSPTALNAVLQEGVSCASLNSFTFTMTSTDNGAPQLQDHDETLITVHNAPPLAVTDVMSTQAILQARLNIATEQLLTNDLDPEGDPLHLIAVGNGQHCQITLDGDTIHFQAAAGFIGNAVFDYWISDGSDTAMASVMVPVTNTLDLGGSLAGIGLTITGAAEDDRAGHSLSFVGDINGDGFGDLIIGADRADPNGKSSAGEASLVYGSGAETPILLATLTADGTGFVMQGATAGDRAGFAVSSGDLNGNGMVDLVIGAPYADPNGSSSGHALAILDPGAEALASPLLLDTTAPALHLNGSTLGDQAGWSLSASGDFNGDGIDDLAIGAPYADPNGSSSGQVSIVFGSQNIHSLDLTAVPAAEPGLVVNGLQARDQTGASVCFIGDFNGDRIDDLAIGAPYADPAGPSSGQVSVVFGSQNPQPVDLATLVADGRGILINGADLGLHTGQTIDSAGDFNGDGLADLLLGVPDAGTCHIVFGRPQATVVDLASPDASTMTIHGLPPGNLFGWAASGVGDINGDGFDDLVIGAPEGGQGGIGYVLFGDPNPSDLTITTLPVERGFQITAAHPYDDLGYALAGGDVNGDGLNDIIIGAPEADPDALFSSGQTSVIFGNDFTGTITAFGTVANDTLSGGLGPDSMVGGTGDDILSGAGGADVLYGGAGNDILIIGDTSFARIDGGTGNDTLQLDISDSVLDLTVLTGTRIRGIETIDLHGDGNSLTISPETLRQLSGITHELTVTGDQSNSVQLIGFDGFTSIDQTQSHGLHVFSDGISTLRVSKDIPLPTTTSEETAEAANRAVTATDDATGSIILRQTLLLHEADLLTNDLDADGDTLAITDLHNFSGGVATLTDGVIRFQADAGFTGSAHFDYTVTDGRGSTDTATVTLQILGEIELSRIGTETPGLVINGAMAGDETGYAVSGAGDVNGDGLDDLLIGAHWADTTGNNSGAAFVVFGSPDSTVVDLHAPGDAAVILSGAASGDQAGFAVAGEGDCNGDGLDDIIIGAPYADPHGTSSGQSYVVFGHAQFPFIDFGGFASHGFSLSGSSSSSYSGYAVSMAGDTNGDGLADLLIGAYKADPNGTDSGQAFLVFGSSTPGTSDLATLNSDPPGMAGVTINGAHAGDYAGYSVSGAGDVNGDGVDDLIIGAYHADNSAGLCHVIFGSLTPETEIHLTSLGDRGFAIHGGSGWEAGRSVSGAGDINGDGLADLVIGAPGSGAGQAAVVFGKPDNTSVNLSTLDNQGFLIEGAKSGDDAGHAVSGVGDVNGDGMDDLLISAHLADPNGTSSGQTYLLFGGSNIDHLDLATLSPEQGLLINGAAASDYSGRSVSGAGDVNGDGFADLVIGAEGADPNGDKSGQGYVIFGADFTGSVSHLGTPGSDTLTGDAQGNAMVGGQGDDMITGQGGVDVLYGGSGDDVLSVRDSDFRRLDGGTGFDTLRLDGSNLDLDLTQMADNRILAIERIDLNGNGNSLSMSYLDLVQMLDNGHQLEITGDSSNSLTLHGFDNYAHLDPPANGGSHQFDDGITTLLVQNGILLSV